MAHQLGFIQRNHLESAFSVMDAEGIPKDNQWSQYWISYKGKLYQFKYAVEVASRFTNTPIDTIDFTSNESSRNYIAGLGFQILFREPGTEPANYWVGACYYGAPGNQVDMFNDFLENGYWRTDHDLSTGEGKKIVRDLNQVQPNDRICIRYIDKKGSRVQVAAMGTVTAINETGNGKLSVNWDYNPPKFEGRQPRGSGAGNWWRTLFQLKREDDIATIFGFGRNGKRVARMAWNTNGWVMPSGPHGKSNNKESHEGQFGYGHEEWMFDFSKLIDGYHYGFLEPIHKQQQAYTYNTYDVWLYSIDSASKKRYWVGEIKNVSVIDDDEAERVREHYVRQGWMKEMEDQIRASGANERGFSNWAGLSLFNIKFRPRDIMLNDPYYVLPKDHVAYTISRYTFTGYTDAFELPASGPGFHFPGTAGDEEDETGDGPATREHTREPKTVQITYLHEAISKALAAVLRKEYGRNNVHRELPTCDGGTRIDLAVNHDGRITFYEIKTYPSLKTCIREAFGQLMEYCFYPDAQKAKELIIVSQWPADEASKKYLDHLRATTGIEIYYQSFDIDSRILSAKC